MRIRKMTVVLPPRLRGMAEHEARRIADEAAMQMQQAMPGGSLHIELKGNGLAGHALTAAVGRSLGSRIGGRG